MDLLEVQRKIGELKKNPELANTSGYEMEELRDSAGPVYWFLLLMEQPQFVRHCDLERLEDWQVRRIRKKQPQLFEPQG